MKNVSRYWKAVVAAVVVVGTTAVTTAQGLTAKGGWTTADTLVEIITVLGAIGVYAVPNTPVAGTGA